MALNPKPMDPDTLKAYLPEGSFALDMGLQTPIPRAQTTRSSPPQKMPAP